MPPKKKAAGKKEGSAAKRGPEIAEPDHDPRWEQAVVSGVLDFSPAELPDANTWPTHGALRERLLLALKALEVPACHAVRDAFLAELVRLTPPELARLVLREAPNLMQLVVAPLGSLPALEVLDLTACPRLAHVFIQSPLLHTLRLDSCCALGKAIVYCKRLSALGLAGCSGLKTLMLWSDALTVLSLPDSTALVHLDLRCPALVDRRGIPPLARVPAPALRAQPPLASIMKEQYQQRRKAQVDPSALQQGICRGQTASTSPPAECKAKKGSPNSSTGSI